MGTLNTVVLVVIVLFVDCYAMNINEIEEFSDFLKKTSVLDQNLKVGFTTGQSEEDDDISDHAWEDSGRFEGDIILNERQRRLIVEDVAEGLSRNGLRDSTKRWPDNEVIFYIQREHFTGDQIDAIKEGIDDLAQASCIKFRPYRKGDRDAVVIQGSRRGCFSQVGYQGGYQVLNLSGRHPVGRGCFRHGTVVHELLHTLGFFHMQSSPDRDDYIKVAWENIIPQTRHNFKKYNTFAVSDFGVGYDYESVLHYSRRAFSINGRDTLIPKQSGAEIGQRRGLSDKDTQKLNKMYCDAGSSNFDADPAQKTERTPKSNNKNKRNKPFQGHGIGYHKGKTVIIKLPAAETVHLTERPTFDSFNYFSQSPKAGLEANPGGFGTTQEITPLEPVLQGYTPVFSDIKPDKTRPKDEVEINRPQDNIELNEERTPTIENDDKEITTTSAPTAADYEKTFTNKDFTKAFGALENILKTHYQTMPKPYEVSKDFNGFFESNRLNSNTYKEKADDLLKALDDLNIQVKKTEIINTDEKKILPTKKQSQHFHEYDRSYGTSLPTKSTILNQPNKVQEFDSSFINNNNVNKVHNDIPEQVGGGRQPYILLGALVPLTEEFYKQKGKTNKVERQNETSTQPNEDFSISHVKDIIEEKPNKTPEDQENIYEKDEFYKPYVSPYEHYEDSHIHHHTDHEYSEPEKYTNSNIDAIINKDKNTPIFDTKKYNNYVPYESLTNNETKYDTAPNPPLSEYVPKEYYKISFPYNHEDKESEYVPKYSSKIQAPAVYEVTENPSSESDDKLYFNSNMNDRLSRLLQQDDNYDYYDISRQPVDHYMGSSRIISKFSPRFKVERDERDSIYFYSS